MTKNVPCATKESMLMKKEAAEDPVMIRIVDIAVESVINPDALLAKTITLSL